MGQNTGTSKIPKKVMNKDFHTALKHENQTLNSGNLLAKGRNSCVSLVGKSKSASDSSGSNCGEMNPIN